MCKEKSPYEYFVAQKSEMDLHLFTNKYFPKVMTSFI